MFYKMLEASSFQSIPYLTAKSIYMDVKVPSLKTENYV